MKNKPAQQQQQQFQQQNTFRSIIHHQQQQSTTPSPPPLPPPPSSNSPHVLTRSAAQRHAAATTPVSPTVPHSVTTRSNSRISLTSTSHHSQHINNGKIVKPIAVRASSSASSVSSLSNHHHGNLSASQHAKNALIATQLIQQQQQQQHKQRTQQQQQQQQQKQQEQDDHFSNFSLIAKYFASFPANRLKQQQQQQQQSSLFGVPQSVKNKSAESAELCKHFNHIVKLSDTTTATSPVPSAITAIIPVNNQPTPTYQPVISPNHSYTSSNVVAPIFDISRLAAMPTLSTNKPLAQFSSILFANNSSRSIESPSFVQQQQDGDEELLFVDSGGEENTAYNQITMETRSTRKFLIKYHPYLQAGVSSPSPQLLHQQRNKINSNKKQQLNTTATVATMPATSGMELRRLRKRPSINLIKMKNTKIQATAATTLESSPSLLYFRHETPATIVIPAAAAIVTNRSNSAATAAITPVADCTLVDAANTNSSENNGNSNSNNVLVIDESAKLMKAPASTVVDYDHQKMKKKHEHQQQQQQKIICNCNATMQHYTSKCGGSRMPTKEDLSSICGSKSSNTDADSGYYSDLNVKLNESISSSSSNGIFAATSTANVLPKHNYYTRYCAAIGVNGSSGGGGGGGGGCIHTTTKLNCSSASSTCTCDLDLNQIEND